MADLKGTAYRSIHPSALADGQPLDTAAHHFIKNNNINNFERGDAVALPLLTASNTLIGGTGDRPHTSLEWTTIFISPITVGERFDRVRVSGLIRVADLQDLMHPPLGYHLRLVAFGEVTEVFVDNTNNRYVPFEVEVSGIRSASRTGNIELWGRGQVGVIKYFSYVPVSHRKDLDIAAEVRVADDHETPYIDAPGAQPNVLENSLDLHCTSFEGGGSGGSDTVYFDHVRSTVAVAGTSIFKSGMVLNPINIPINDTDPKIRALGYAQFKSLLIETGYRSDGLYSDADLRANIVEVGEVAQNHNQLIEDTFTRPKLLSAGHGGVPNNGLSTWPVGYRQNWVYADSDAGEVDLFDDIVMIDSRGRVTVRLLVIGCWDNPSGYAPGDDIFGEDSVRLFGWEIKANLLQFSDGSSVPVSCGIGNTGAVEVRHFPLLRNPEQSTFLHQMYWARYQDPATKYSWIYRDGQLHKKDITLIQEITILFNVDPSFSLSAPASINVSASYSNSASSSQRLVIVGHSIHMHPAL